MKRLPELLLKTERQNTAKNQEHHTIKTERMHLWICQWVMLITVEYHAIQNGGVCEIFKD